MKNIIKTFSLLAIFALIPGAFAANATRVSVRGQASTRGSSLSIAGKIRAIAANASYSTATQWLSSTECVENYTGCLKDAAVCGEDLEECTNTVLLHAKMPSCLNVLMQCKSADVVNLFGSGATMNNLYTVASDGGKNSAGEIIKYAYPTNTSILGQMIESAAITNRLSASQCVKKYTSCLHKDSVCGEDFELCTSKKEFKKNALMCESTLARCQSDGKTELFGGLTEAESLLPADKSRLNDMIKAGAQLAATNTLATCNKVADQCILKACSTNPTHCMEGVSNAAKIAAINLLKDQYGDSLDSSVLGAITADADDLTKSTKADVKKFIKGTCLETIGSNKYCYIVHKSLDDDTKVKAANVASILGNDNFKLGEEDVADVFESIYDYRMNEATKKKIQDLANVFDTKAKDACSETISECAMQSCGGGLGSLCYKKVFLNGSLTGKNGVAIATGRSFGNANSINGSSTYDEIQRSCEAVVNTNVNCQYAYAVGHDQDYNYAYTNVNGSAFDYLFPALSGAVADNDPIGVVGRLNAALASSYNEAAIENMRKQCANTALACVKSMCGADYTNCYRNRTDVRLSGEAGSEKGGYEGDNGFAKSMNKMGGVLDYNIVTGLCVNTVKNASACEEHLKIAAATWRDSDMQDNSSWKDGSTVRSAWLDANTTKASVLANENEIVTGCVGTNQQAQNNDKCDTSTQRSCGFVDDYGCLYDVEVKESVDSYALTRSAETLFQQVLVDVEREVQAKYNAKITREQNMCLTRNAGGVRGKNDNGSTYMWVKLNKNKVPANYSMKGLAVNDFRATGDLYGGFCRVRIHLLSDDKFIQQELTNTEAYFAVGDTFVCGSWLTQKQIDAITNAVRNHALGLEKGFDSNGKAKEGYTKKDAATLAWTTVGSFLVGGIGSYFAMDAAQRKGKSIGGLLGHNITTNRTTENKKYARQCVNEAENAQRYKALFDGTGDFNNWTKAVDSANSAVRYARLAGVQNPRLSVGLKGTDSKAREMQGYFVTREQQAAPAATTATAADEALATPGATTPGTTSTGDKNDFYSYYNIPSFSYGAYTPGIAKACKWEGDEQLKVIAKIFADKYVADGPDADSGYMCKAAAKAVLAKIAVAPTKSESTPYTTLLLGCKLAEVNAEVANGTLTADCDGGVAATSYTTFKETAEYKSFNENLQALKQECEIVEAGDRYDYANNPQKYLQNNMLAGFVGSAVTTALGAGIAKTVLDVKYENIQDEAAKKWLEEIGSHIQCVIGTDEAGSFGDTVTIDYDE